jgi:membrane-associated phospholipid phosphatase
MPGNMQVFARTVNAKVSAATPPEPSVAVLSSCTAVRGDQAKLHASSIAMIGKSPFRYWLVAFALCAAAAAVCVAYVDRPVADYVHVHLLQLVIVGVLNDMLTGLELGAAFAFVFLIAAGCWKIAGRQLAAWTRTPLLCSWSLMWALSSAEGMKRVFGRAEPDMWTGFTPTDPHLSLYGFHLFRMGPQFESFPSGTTAVAAAVLSVLWIVMPRLRWLWALTLAIVAISVVITNSHFVSDVIAGGFLGASIGWMTVHLQDPRRAGSL